MATGNVIIFSKNKADLRVTDIAAATIKLGLVTSAWTPDATVTGNSLWADMSASEIAGVNGYTTGGAALASLLSTAITGGFKFSSGNASWTASGGNIAAFRYAVIYVVGTLWGKVNPVIGYMLLDSTPADVPATTTGNTVGINCPAAGWFDIT